MPVPPTLTSYLPVLLVSVQHNAAPDDTSFSTLPEGQVDYLSHEWREEDVWRSWRNMTRQKNAIANGMRLENASWRTWWKQRNKLKTISPETLNWLKDSDVTWLYGPLHVGSDWTPTSHEPEMLHRSQRKGSAEAISTCRTSAIPKKPILKRRSIGQLLSLPSSHWLNHGDMSDDEATDHMQEDDFDFSVAQRPPLLHTKSDTHISWRGRAFRKESPPRIIAEDTPASPTTLGAPVTATLSDVSNSTGSDQDLSGSSSTGPEGAGAIGALTEANGAGGKKKHISFNTFVEQYIAIEKPKKRPSLTGGRSPRVTSFDDGYEEDSEIGYEEYDEPSSFYVGTRAGGNSDSEDEDDDVLEMRTASSRSRSSPGSQRFNGTSEASLLGPRFRPPLVRRSSNGGGHATIAPIAPTMLKSTGVGNNLLALGARGMRPVPQDAELVYVPPANSNYSLPSSPKFSGEDVFHHRESYFSVGTNEQAVVSMSPPMIPSASVLPPPPHLPISVPVGRGASHLSSSPPFFPDSISESPMEVDSIDDAGVETTFDYFEGADMGDGSERWPPYAQSRERDSDRGATGVPRYAEGGAASVTNGRSSGHEYTTYSPHQSPDMPVVVVNRANGATEERTERSREGSPSYADLSGGGVSYPRVVDSQECAPGSPTFLHVTPASTAMPVPRIATANPHISLSPQVANPALLSPTDGSCRGRAPACASVSGSTTTGSSYSRSTDSRSDSRGRSLTRNSSFSDRECSGSRSSRGTNSPLGSISPTGSSLGLGGSSYPGQARGSSRSGAKPGRKGSGDVERGRDRSSGRRIGDSSSPPSLVNSPSTPSREIGEYQSYSPILPVDKSLASSPPSSVSGSSTASVSTVGPSKPPLGSEPDVAAPRPRTSSSGIPSISLPPPIAEEDEQRSLHPTPANSPVFSLSSARGDRAAPKPKLPESPVSPPPRSPMSPAKESPTSPTRHKGRGSLELDQGTIVGQMVSSARGFLGAIWNASAA